MHRLPKLLFAGAVALGAVVAAPVAASAQAYPGGITEERKNDPGDPGDVLGTGAQRPAEVRGVQATRGLAVTGGDVVGLTLIGGGLVAGGVVLVRRSRKPLATATA